MFLEKSRPLFPNGSLVFVGAARARPVLGEWQECHRHVCTRLLLLTFVSLRLYLSLTSGWVWRLAAVSVRPLTSHLFKVMAELSFTFAELCVVWALMFGLLSVCVWLNRNVFYRLMFVLSPLPKWPDSSNNSLVSQRWNVTKYTLTLLE